MRIAALRARLAREFGSSSEGAANLRGWQILKEFFLELVISRIATNVWALVFRCGMFVALDRGSFLRATGLGIMILGHKT